MEPDEPTVAGETVVRGADRRPRAGSEPHHEFGDYQLLGEIARGGQGVVFRARQRSLNRLVALKMIALGTWATEPHLKRFRTEAAAAANLDHPQIVPIYEIGEVGGQHYFTMKLVEGVSLKQVTADGPLISRRAATILADAARAIHYAHERGILHRDIKPSNILLDAEDQCYVTDFGLAKLVEDESTVTNTMDVLGTPSYMPPEQAAGHTRDLTRTADVYGLGAVFYELLTGNPPFAGGTTLETIRQVMEKEPLPPRRWNPKVDRDLDTICLKCLEKEPGKRYPTAQALADDLERWLRFEPIQARPTGPVGRAVKWARRNPARCAVAGALAVAAAAVGMVLYDRMSRPPEVDLPSVAVVFQAEDKNSTALAKARSRDLIHFLSNLSGLRCLSKSDVARWEGSNESLEQIGRATDASAVLLAELRDVQGACGWNLTLQSFHGPSRGARWTQSLTNGAADWEALQSQLARQIVAQLDVRSSGPDQLLLRRPTSRDIDAQDKYVEGLRALDIVDMPSQLKAAELFEEAVQRDQGFAQAHAMLGFARLNLGYNYLEPDAWMGKARAAVAAALTIDPQLPEAIVADACLKYFYEWDWAAARQALDTAVRLDLTALEGNACYLHMLDVFGNGEEALTWVRRAVARHPNSPAIREELACSAYYAGRFREAEDYCRRNLARDTNNAYARWQLARILVQREAYDEALEHLALGKAASGPEPWVLFDMELGFIQGKRGLTNEARQVLESMRARQRTQYVDPYLFALVYSGLGDDTQVFHCLEEAVDKRSSFMPSLPVESKFAPFRNDPRYQNLLVRLKLPAKMQSLSTAGK